MAAAKSVSACVREIKKINAIFRRLKGKETPAADKLISLKDALINEMVAACPHPSVIAFRGGKGRRPARICSTCGHSESLFIQKAFRDLAGRPATYLPLEDFRLQTGLIMNRVGIDFN